MSKRTWVYTSGGNPLSEPIEVGADFENAPGKVLDRVDVSYMDGLRATDGTDISSKRKRREYMHVNGLADTSDFKEHWVKAAKRRDEVLSGNSDTKERREIIGRALYAAKGKRR